MTYEDILFDSKDGIARSHLAQQRAIDPPLLLTCLIAWRKLFAREAFRSD
jgi:hypothetical protein